jgi:hypothetical protein
VLALRPKGADRVAMMHRLYRSHSDPEVSSPSRSYCAAVSWADEIDDPREVAVEFGKTHQLSNNYVNQIEQFIIAHIS